MKFTNIAAAFALFASSFTYAAILPADQETLIENLMERVEKSEKRMAIMEKEFSTIDGYDGWIGSTLKMLPVWGNEDYETNFQWPSEEAWALMDPNTSVTSMEFSRPENTFWELASVRLNYSDGETVFLENITHGTSFPM